MHRLKIESLLPIENVQKQFNGIFPYLKIEFFREPHVAGKGTAKNKIIDATTRLGLVQKIKKDGTIEVKAEMNVSTFEKLFEDRFGLYVQVFRKSGSIWLETSATDSWTLEQQNEEGKSLAQHLRIERESTDDHDVY